MGLTKAINSAISGVLADQWKEYFYCDSLDGNTLVKKAQKRNNRSSENYKGNGEIISRGSIIAVADGQCMLIVDQGKVVDVCAEPGEYIYDSSTEPSLFFGKLSKQSMMDAFTEIKNRFGFGGQAVRDQRIYYINTKEFVGNRYGTPAPVPFRVVDQNVGLDMDISIRCFGEYSYRIVNPLLFYSNVCGNVGSVYNRENIDSQLKSEILTYLQPAFAQLSEMGLRYSALPGHTKELSDVLNSLLSEKWKNTRGIELSSLGISSLKASDEDEKVIKDLQRSAAFRDPVMAAAQLINAQSEAMLEAAKNTSVGSAMAFMGIDMASKIGGINAESLMKMGLKNKDVPPLPETIGSWTCSCGNQNSGNFCGMCGRKCPGSK